MTKMRDSMPVVFAVLAGIFLLMIIFEWGGQGTIFNRSGDAETLGLVNGQKITQQEYNKILEAVTADMKSKNKKANLSETDEDQANSEAWDQAVSQALEDQSIEKMGITVTDQEIRDVIFNNPPADVRQQFTDSVGHFHQDAYIKALRDPRNDSIVRNLEADYRTKLLHLKWQQAIVSTVRVTDSEAYTRFLTDSAKAILQIIKIPAPQVTPQMASQVSDKDIQAYYDAHTWLYKQDEQRKFKFVMFPLLANGRDSALALETANSLKGRLSEAPLATIDTVAKELAQDYSDVPFQPQHVVTMRELGDDTSLMSLKDGDAAVAHVSGSIMALRIVHVFDTGAAQYHIRRITLDFPHQAIISQQTKDSLRAIADQIVQQLKSGGNFAEIARTRSADPRTATKGGDMGWVDTGIFPFDFRSAIVHASKGDLLGPLESPRGYDIIQVMGRAEKAWLVSGVQLAVKPSHQTLQLEQQMANIFRENAQKNGFDQAATAGGYHVITDAPPVSKKGEPIFSSYEFVDWVFQSSKGDISPALKLSRVNAVIVAQLSDITPEGPKPLADVKNQIAEQLALNKQIAGLSSRAQQVRTAIGPNGDLSAPATSLGDATLAPITVLMGPAESVNGLPTAEYVINNWAYSAQPGTISPPLKGEHGYYIAKLMGRTIPTQKDFEAAKPNIVKTITQEKEQRMMMDWMSNLKAHATIVDYRIPH